MPLEEKNPDSNTILKNVKKPTEPKQKSSTTPAKTTPAKKPATKTKSNQLNSKENQTKLTDFLKGKSTKPRETESELKVKSPKLKLPQFKISPAELVISPKPTMASSSTSTSPVTRSKSALMVKDTTCTVKQTINKPQKNGKSPAKKICLIKSEDSEQNKCNKGISCDMDGDIHREDDDLLIKSLTLSAEQLKLKETDTGLFWEQTAEAVRVDLAEYLEDNKGVCLKKIKRLLV